MRKPLSEKILVLGIDGMDPALTKKYLDAGKMPNLQQLITLGACRQDLVMLGSMPTVTPPMWTTLATGATAATHGLTCFFNQHPEKLDTCISAFDSRMSKAEPLWNVFAESGRKTLVWHWPGSAWPPTSDNPNLYVVDGTQPAAINMGYAIADWEMMAYASIDTPELLLTNSRQKNVNGAGCVMTELPPESAEQLEMNEVYKSSETRHIMLNEDDGEIAILGSTGYDIIHSPLRETFGWTNAEIPEGSKEFVLLFAKGTVRRFGVLVKSTVGYDQVWLFKSKTDNSPYGILPLGIIASDIIDELLVDDQKLTVNRSFKLVEAAQDGSALKLWISPAYDIANDTVWHPKSLYQTIVNNVGYVPPSTLITGAIPANVSDIMLPVWDLYVDWQANCLTYLMANEGFQIIFSHIHNVDNIGHQIWHYGKHQEIYQNDEAIYQVFIDETYQQADRYIGYFLPFISDGWTILLVSDHGLIVTENHPEIMGQALGVNVQVMEKLGFTVMKKDTAGNTLKEIDWSQTRAVAIRANHIWINLKGRYATGIVDPEDKYALEDEIITALYHYLDPKTGKRLIELAVRNKEAAVFGMNGSESGDIVYFLAEGFNGIHCDSLSTHKGYYGSSVSPLFVAAGPGIKTGLLTERVIRQPDIAPTMAVLGGVRMPAQCEGAPIYQILAEEF